MATGSLPARESLPPDLQDYFPQEQPAYLKDLFSLDPGALAAQVKVPALIVRGALATGISAADSDLLSTSLGPGAEELVGPEAGHTLALEAPPPAAAPSDGGGHDDHGSSSAAVGYRRDRALLGRITAWLAAHLGAPGGAGAPAGAGP